MGNLNRSDLHWSGARVEQFQLGKFQPDPAQRRTPSPLDASVLSAPGCGVPPMEPPRGSDAVDVGKILTGKTSNGGVDWNDAIVSILFESNRYVM